MSDTSAGHSHDAGRYAIRLKGHLGSRWAARFDGMALTTRADGTTLIEGPVVDQAALHGLLRTLRDIGLPLLSVTRLESGRPQEKDPPREGEMAITVPTAAPSRAPMGSTRKTALVAGMFYLITFAASIPAVVLLGPVLNHADYIVSSGADTRVLWGCFLDVVNALACVGTAVALFPVVKRQNEATALGFVTSRMFEAAVILIGVVSLLAVVTLRRDLAGAPGTDPASLVTTGRALVAVRDWTFLLGPSLMPGINALLLGYLMYRSGLVPRAIPVLGLIGAPLLIASATTTLFRGNDPVTVFATIATAPIFLWELSLGVWLVVKGFKPSPITTGIVTA